MRKKLFVSAFATCILVAIASVLFSSCKEEEEKLSEIRYPENISYEPYKIAEEEGSFWQDKDGNWCFYFDNESVYLRNFDCTTGNMSIVENMPEEYKNTKGKFRVSGTLQFAYTKVYFPTKSQIGAADWTYKLKISSVHPIEQSARTRVANETSLVCGSLETTPPAWLFSRTALQTSRYSQAEFRVFVHVVRSSAGEGLSTDIATDMVNQLNSFFCRK